MSKPTISVIMSTFNDEQYIVKSVESILNQTYTDFEFLIADDGSTENTAEILKHFQQKDERIKVYLHNENKGLPLRLNQLIDKSRGKYIARMDGDDISLQNRLEKQFILMSKNPKLGLSGTWVKTYGYIDGKIWKYPTTHKQISSFLLFNNPIAHPTAIINKQLLQKHNLRYDPKFRNYQDYELWSRCVNHFETANINEVLLLHKVDENKHLTYGDTKKVQLRSIIRQKLLSNINLKPSTTELIIHNSLGDYQVDKLTTNLRQINNWLEKIIQANLVVNYYDNNFLNSIINDLWHQVIRQRAVHPFKFSRTRKLSIKQQILLTAILTKRMIYSSL